MTGTTTLGMKQKLPMCSLNLLAEQGCIISGPITAEDIVSFFFCVLRCTGPQDVEFKSHSYPQYSVLKSFRHLPVLFL